MTEAGRPAAAVPPPVVRARGLTKRFGEFTAVDGIDFEVAAGEAFGFLGPNGAGKSSTMRMIACVSPPSAGSLTVLGGDPQRNGSAIRSRLGVVPQEDTLDVELTVRENLVVHGRYFDLSRRAARARAEELLDFVGLADRAGSKVEPLSGGQKRRLTIARGLVNRPELLLLDEPTTGLDPQARHVVWEQLYRLKSRGVTVVLTTHYMDEAEQLCDRLVVMDDARIVAEGSPRELVARYSSREVLELRFAAGGAAGGAGGVDRDRDRDAGDGRQGGGGGDGGGDGGDGAGGDGDCDGGDGAGRRPGNRAALAGLGERIEELADRTLIYTDDGDAVAAEAHRRGLRPVTTLVRRASLEDVFLRLTGRSLDE